MLQTIHHADSSNDCLSAHCTMQACTYMCVCVTSGRTKYVLYYMIYKVTICVFVCIVETCKPLQTCTNRYMYNKTVRLYMYVYRYGDFCRSISLIEEIAFVVRAPMFL